MPWLFLSLAIASEVGFTIAIKSASEEPRVSIIAVTGVFLAASLGFLMLALRTLPLSAAYPIWVGSGALGAVIIGRYLFDEPLSVLKLASIAAITAGVIGLKFASGH